MTSALRTCFITAPAGTSLDVLVNALRHRNITVVVPQYMPPGVGLETEAAGVLRNADLVIGVLTRERRSEWILFELGQAWTLGKRILLFAPPSSTHLPSTLRRFLTVRASVSNREAVDFALDQLLAAPEPTRKAHQLPMEKPRLGYLSSQYLHGDIASISPIELEALVANVLRDAGVDVLATSRDRKKGADLAIWSDALQPFVGNPLLVEIKSRLQGAQGAAEVAQQLSRHVTAAGGLWGLLLYAVGPQELKSLPPNIIALPIEVLFRLLEQESFDNVIRELRNQRVHGVGR